MGSTQHLEQYQFKQEGGEPMAQNPICVKFPQSVDEQLRAMSDRSGFIRRAVDAALKAAGTHQTG